METIDVSGQQCPDPLKNVASALAAAPQGARFKIVTDDYVCYMKIAERYGVKVVEDTAQALGAEYRGRKVGAIGHISTFSLYATKHITSGEGGAVATDVTAYAERAKLIRAHGEVGKYSYEILGYNYRMVQLQSLDVSLLRVILKEVL